MGYVASGKPKGRPKQFYKYELPTGVVKVVRAQCADYERKKIAFASLIILIPRSRRCIIFAKKELTSVFLTVTT